MGPEGRVLTLPSPEGLSSLEVDMGTASRALGLAMPAEEREGRAGGHGVEAGCPHSVPPRWQRSLLHRCLA